MRLDIQSRDFSLTEALFVRIRRRIAFALSARSDSIQRVQVRLADINGPRGGQDKRCRVHVVLNGASDVVVENTDNDLYAAIDRAISRAGHSVARRLARQRVRQRAQGLVPVSTPLTGY